MKPALASLVGLIICAAFAHAAEVKVTAVMATGAKAKPTTTFASDTGEIHVLFKTTGAQKGDTVRTVFIAEDVGDKAPANTKIDEKTLSLEGDTENGDFSMTKPTKGWPAGKYRVEIYAGDKLATTTKFTVEDGSKPVQPSPAPAAAAEKKRPTGGNRAIKFPANDPAFTVEFPANWTHRTDEDGNIDCKAGDDETYACSLLILEDVHNSKELKAALPELANAMADEIKLEDFELGDTMTDQNGNGVSFSGIMGDGKADGIEFVIMVHGFEAQKGRFYALVTAGTPQSDAKHEKEYDDVTASITPIGN